MNARAVLGTLLLLATVIFPPCRLAGVWVDVDSGQRTSTTLGTELSRRVFGYIPRYRFVWTTGARVEIPPGPYPIEDLPQVRRCVVSGTPSRDDTFELIAYADVVDWPIFAGQVVVAGVLLALSWRTRRFANTKSSTS